MEKDLFGPIKQFFEKEGYVCDGEVKDIDMYMEKPGEGPQSGVAIELKVSLDFRALQQAALRQKVVNTVFIGIFKPKDLRTHAFHDKVYLLKRLGIGLIFVSKRSGAVEIYNEPVVTEISKYQSQNKKKKEIISAEFQKRKAKNNVGGVTGTKLITSYREDALLVLDALAELGGEATTKEVRALSKIDRATNIMHSNHYGWFAGVSKGVYRIRQAGYDALEEFEDALYILKRGNV